MRRARTALTCYQRPALPVPARPHLAFASWYKSCPLLHMELHQAIRKASMFGVFFSVWHPPVGRQREVSSALRSTLADLSLPHGVRTLCVGQAMSMLCRSSMFCTLRPAMQPMRRVEMCVYRMLYSLLKDMRLLTVLKAALARPEHSIS